MASTLKTILAQVQTQIKNSNGSGVYTYDLSPAGRVVRGVVTDPPVDSPAVGIFHQQTSTTPGARLGYWERTTTVGIHGWIASDGTEGDAEDAAADLFNDILRTLEADRSLSSNVRDITADGVFFGGGSYSLDGWGIVAIDLKINWSQQAGV